MFDTLKRHGLSTAKATIAVILAALGILYVLWLNGIVSLPVSFHVHANTFPSQYVGDRSAFTSSIKSYSDATSITNAHGDVNQVSQLTTSSIASSKNVSDGFLDYLDPQLKDEYRNKLIAGEQDFLQGLNESTPTDTVDSPGPKLQLQGIQLEQEWTNWWNTHSKAITDKAFAN